MKTLTILTTAWNRHPARFEYFKVMVESVEKLLDLKGVDYEWIVSIEEKGHYRKEEMERYMLEHGMRYFYHSASPGLGRNLNFALDLCHSSLILYIQDDCVQVLPLSIMEDVEFLLSKESKGVGVIRYWQQYQREIEKGHMWVLDEGRNYYNLHKDAGYYYNDHVHLKKKTFHDLTGPYDESIQNGIDFSKCENTMKRQARSIYDKMRIIAKNPCNKMFPNGYFGKQVLNNINHDCLKEKQMINSKKKGKRHKEEFLEDDLGDWLNGKRTTIEKAVK